MLTVEEALEIVLNRCRKLDSIKVRLEEAAGYVTSDAIYSRVDLPAFDNSAVDGYAVYAADTLGACQAEPVTLPVSHTSAAGASEITYLKPGQCSRIFTGAPLPVGADAVVMQEDVSIIGSAVVRIELEAELGQHVRAARTDIARGELVLDEGVTLGVGEIAAASACGVDTMPVYRSPRVAVVTTGDEVVDLGVSGDLPFGAIYNSNRYLLSSLVRLAGAELICHRHIADDLEATCSVFAELVGLGVDAIVCAGGVSVGDRDFVKPALERLGSLEIWRVAMKPGKPLAFGSIQDCLFFGLPGNPASALVTFELFVRPAICHMAGRKDGVRETVRSVLTDPIEHLPGRREYVRAWTEWSGAGYVSQTTGAQGSGRIRSLLRHNSLIIVPTDCSGIDAGDEIRVLLTPH